MARHHQHRRSDWRKLAPRNGHLVCIRNAATRSSLRLSGLLLNDPRSRGQEFAEECGNNVLRAYGRCLRPALYSSLRSSPSHPAGVSALRVTIAIASARFARKRWRLLKSTDKSPRLFCNKSATSRRVWAGAIEGSTATTRTAFCRKSLRVPRVFWLGSRSLGTRDRETTTTTEGRPPVIGLRRELRPQRKWSAR
ncbi:hypothetical protein M2427_008389 [Bradyrhizobium sp. BR13661]|jgi:hypothetical protein|nr:hypothetical protein [Bradyrhizobium sp. BR13661]